MSQLNQKLFQISCYIPSKLGVSPLKWNNKTQQLVYRSNDNSGLISKRKLNIQFLIYTFIPLQGLHCFYLDPNSYNFSFTDKMMFGLVLFGLLASIIIEKSCVTKASSQLQYANGMEEFSKNLKILVYKKSFVQKLNLAWAACTTPSAILVPILLVYPLHWFSPCKPSIAGYPLIPECYSEEFENSFWNFVIKVIILGGNHWSWTAGLSCVVCCTCCFLILKVQSFEDFLHVFEQMTDGKTEKSIYRSVICYRTTQLLGCLCNEVQQFDLMVVEIVGGTLTLISAINAAVLVPWTMENTPGLLFFGLCTVNMSFFLLVCIGAMAKVFQEFEAVLCRLKKRKMIIGNCGRRLCFKWRERFYWSCAPVKFKIGWFNFVERLTPLNCIMFAIEQSVSILLLGKKY